MFEFVNWIKSYIFDFFANDTDITKEVVVENADKKGNEITTNNVPQIQVQVLNSAENERFSSLYEGENITTYSLQFTSYTSNMKINGQMTSAQDASFVFADKLKTMLNARQISTDNKNIKRCVIISTSPAMALLEGKVYTTAIRCQFWVSYPYDNN